MLFKVLIMFIHIFNQIKLKSKYKRLMQALNIADLSKLMFDLLDGGIAILQIQITSVIPQLL